MTAEALIGYSEAAFLTVGFIAILMLLLRVYHPANRDQMDHNASIPFRGEDAPDPASQNTSLPDPHVRHTNHG